jgi:transketolase
VVADLARSGWKEHHIVNSPDSDLTVDAELEERAINVVRALAMDGPMKANSGHQGTAMALAPLAHVLFTRIMTYDAGDPAWPDRDRFILSNGHASILLYSMLHLTGHGLELEDLEQFRQWESRTPGHPEAGHTAGVEVTTGPLGQGFGNSVGMAVAERFLRERFGSELCDHYTYVMAGDGDLSEGVSHEAASLAGHLGLGRLVVAYDNNHITIDGSTELALSDNAAARFEAYGWDVIDIGDKADDLATLTEALEKARANTEQPSLIMIRSHVGYPSPKWTDHHEAHGNPFDPEEIAATKSVMGLPPDESFWIPDDVRELYRSAGRRGADSRRQWRARVDASDEADLFRSIWTPPSTARTDEIRRATAKVAAGFTAGEKVATRKASQAVLDELSEMLPTLVGGAADLTGNTGTKISGQAQSAGNPGGRQLFFGVREHAMAASLVGAARHGGVVPIGGTFLVFSDYMRPSVRLAAMSKARCVFVWTHDSVGVGEDGPTHQPVEHIMSLRAIPGLQVVRPADVHEVAGAWALAVETDGPTALVLSRQGVPVLAETNADSVRLGAYRLVDNDDAAVTLVATGSEVAVALEAAELLAAEGIAANVVSMPCWELFDQQPEDHRNTVLDPWHPTVSVEAGVTLGWERYADATIGIDRFGASAPGSEVLRRLGISAESVAATAQELLAEERD